ncbi:D-2-hydroxyacid dehydrogenase [Halobacillus sp. BBL2006]|uniref:D-2-hydroxyacid dehydrogenase n=1 Tax=Halobacillus sp. BBL2006 TaxID=1543706 RepID=UPI000542BD8A|nr:D-2-hydroxyacid dehydrogenase [Halobacillus sp. BBL2006]KHE66883.1 3-phosphoglycerate dehydrogenase [Halobacillus sp. BBL2006]
MKVVSAIKRVPDSIKDRLTQRFSQVEFAFYHGIEEAEPHLGEADIFVTYGEDLNPGRIEKAVRLKWIMVLSAGLDRMPFDEIADRGILVTNVRGIHAHPMAEYAISMLLQVSRKAKTLIEQEQNHQWNRRPVMNEISGRTMVLLGTGAICQETARLAQAFQMKTIGVSKSGKQKEYFHDTYKVEELKEVLSEADFVVAALPSTEETKYLLKINHFQTMADHAIFLNMGRGDLVSTEVVLKAVREKYIDHAVLDVFEEEPLPEDHPFWEEENVTVTPHISGISPYYQPRAFERFEENLHIYLEGKEEMNNKIDPRRGY